MRAILLLIALIGASTVCADDLDVIFVVDGSRTLCDDALGGPCASWKAALRFIHNIVATWPIGPNDNKVAFLTLGDVVKMEWNLDRYPDKTQLLTAIDNVPYPDGDLDIADRLKVVLSGILLGTAGDRPWARDVAVLITDGAEYINSVQAAAVSTAMQATGLSVFVVCIQTGCTEAFAKGIASLPKEKNKTYFLVGDYVNGNPSLDSITAPLLAQINAIKNVI